LGDWRRKPIQTENRKGAYAQLCHESAAIGNPTN
jgi:hypothetical protein